MSRSSARHHDGGKQTSLGDNGKTVYFDLYVYGTPSDGTQYTKLLDNAAYHGEREGANLTPLAYGKFCKIVAVWRSGCVACNTGYTNGGWQCCGSIDSNYLSFEMKKNNKYLPGLEQPNWHTLPPKCSITSKPAGNIVCDTTFTLNQGDTLKPTWYEPSHSTSLGDNGKTAHFDLYGLSC